MVFRYQSLAYFWRVFFVVVLFAIIVNRYQFQILANFDKYIENFVYKKKYFLAKYQVLKFYIKYMKVVAKQSSKSL